MTVGPWLGIHVGIGAFSWQVGEGRMSRWGGGARPEVVNIPEVHVPQTRDQSQEPTFLGDVRAWWGAQWGESPRLGELTVYLVTPETQLASFHQAEASFLCCSSSSVLCISRWDTGAA